MPTAEEQKIIDELNVQYGEEFGKAGVRERTEFPTATYTFKMGHAYLARSGASGRKQLTVALVVLEAPTEELKDAKTVKNWGLETTENLQWLNTDAQNLDLDPPKTPAEIPAFAARLEGLVFQAYVTHKDISFPPNIYLNPGARRRELEEKGEAGTPAKPPF